MKTYRGFCQFVLILTGILLAVLSAVVILVDPFFHYHAPWFHMLPVFNNEGYQNSGIARNFSYDSIVTGSSMSENFEVSQFREEFHIDPIKMPCTGGRIKAITDVLRQAFDGDRVIRSVFLDLHLYALKADSEETLLELPNYLYNKNPFDDVNYLLNKKVLLYYVPHFLKQQSQLSPETVYDLAYIWYDTATFSREWVLSHYDRPPTINPSPDPPTLYAEACAQNLANLTPFFEYSETAFYCFIPPYSMLFWDDALRSGNAEAYLYMIRQIAETLLPYQNVRLFFFQDLTEFTTDLDHYRDYGHYEPAMNAYICHSMAEGKHEITSENLDAVIEQMRSFIYSFDYDSFTAS